MYIGWTVGIVNIYVVSQHTHTHTHRRLFNYRSGNCKTQVDIRTCAIRCFFFVFIVNYISFLMVCCLSDQVLLYMFNIHTLWIWKQTSAADYIPWMHTTRRSVGNERHQSATHPQSKTQGLCAVFAFMCATSIAKAQKKESRLFFIVGCIRDGLCLQPVGELHSDIRMRCAQTAKRRKIAPLYCVRRPKPSFNRVQNIHFNNIYIAVWMKCFFFIPV